MIRTARADGKAAICARMFDDHLIDNATNRVLKVSFVRPVFKLHLHVSVALISARPVADRERHVDESPKRCKLRVY
jgi:hypothetical protein